MQKFLKDTISNRYIKALLSDVFIPRYPSVIEGDYIVKGIRYIFNSNIIECVTTGLLGQDGRYKFVSRYEKNNNRLISDVFVSKESFYNAATHKRLGQFLRYYRGQTGIDLMPLYNCFDDTYTSNFSLYKDGIVAVNNPLYKIAQVPIKFNKTYTIAIDCASSIMLAPAFLQKGDYLFVGNTNITNLLYENTSVLTHYSTNFLTPFSYKLDNNDTFLQKYEDYLVLLIQLPISCSSSIVVLEGDYSDVKYRKIINVENVDTFSITTSLPESRIKGDIDGDGYVLESDLELLTNHVSGIEPITNEIALWAADVNNDGEVDADDLTILASYIEHENPSGFEHLDYYNSWVYEPEINLWAYTLTNVGDVNKIVDVSGYNVSKFEIIGNSIKVYCTNPPINDCVIWLSYSSDYSYRGLDSLSTDEKNRLFLANPSLLRMNDKNNYAFSSKLILYLLNSAITSQEDISNNILRAQKAIEIDDYYSASIPDVWSDFLRKVLFDSYVNEYPGGLDVLGYVDNDIEAFLLKRGIIN